MSDFRMTHSTAAGCRVLSLDGSLTVAAAAELNRVVRKLLLDHQTPLICDLAGIAWFSPAALTVFPTSVAAAGGWPVVSVALAAPDEDLWDALDRGGISSRVPVFADVDSVSTAPRSRWRPEVVARTLGLTFDDHAAAEARAATESFCQVLHCGDEHLDDARLVVSELATNAVQHGRPPVALTLLASGDALTIRVSDASSVPARLRPPGAEGGGQGLAVVAGIARSWISEPAQAGKTVSARLSLDRR